MDPRASLDCAVPLGIPTNPHEVKYISAYVNQIGRKAMMEQAVPKFPAGSVIVK